MLAGGAGEGVGPHGRPLRYYVIARARTPGEQRVLGEEPRSLLNELPLTRQSVERVFESLGLDVLAYIDAQLPDAEAEETADERRARAREAWLTSWEDVAKLLPEFHGMDTANELAQVPGKFRWDMRLQRLQEAQLHHDVEAITKPRLLSRAMAMWTALSHIAQVAVHDAGAGEGEDDNAVSLLRELFPSVSDAFLAATTWLHDPEHRAKFIELPDEAFELSRLGVTGLASRGADGSITLQHLPDELEGEIEDPLLMQQQQLQQQQEHDLEAMAAAAAAAAVVQHIAEPYADGAAANAAVAGWHATAVAMVTNEREHADVPLEAADAEERMEWRHAQLSAVSDAPAVQAFRYKYGGGAPPSLEHIQLSVRPTEKEVFHPHAVATRFAYAAAGGVEHARHTLVRADGTEVLHASAPAAWAELRAGHDEAMNAVGEAAFVGQAPPYLPRAWLGRALWGVLRTRADLRILPLHQLATRLAALPDAEEREARTQAFKQSLRACWKGFGVGDHVLDAAADPASSFYTHAVEALGLGGAPPAPAAFVGAYVLVDAGEHVHAAVWCQNWATSLGGRLLEVEANSLYEAEGMADIRAAPYTEFTGPQYAEVDAAMADAALYIRAAGARSAANNRWAYLLQLVALAEHAHGTYKGVIARVPRAMPLPAAVASEDGAGLTAQIAKSAFAPNFAVMADQAQVLGMQRAVSLPIAKLPTDEEARAAVVDLLQHNNVPPATYAEEALGAFELRKPGPGLSATQAKSGPWVLRVKPAFSDDAALTNAEAAIAAGIVRLPGEPAPRRNLAAQTYFRTAAGQHELFPFLVGYFSASIYPTPQQMVGVFALVRLLLEASPHANNTIAGDAPGGVALAGGSTPSFPSMPAWQTERQGLEHDNDDADSRVTSGQLTALERAARRLPEHALWYGSAHDLLRSRGGQEHASKSM